MLSVPPNEYQSMFDAAVDTAREHGMPPLVRDRRGGIIETSPAIAGSLFEPWRGDNAGLGQTIENTVAFQRRRARFEFVQISGLSKTQVEESGGDAIDLTKTSPPLQLQVSVFVERANSPGIRRGTWSRSQTTRNDFVGDLERRSRRDRKEEDFWGDGEGAEDLRHEPDVRGRQQALFWTPIYRDSAYEQLLLEGVRDKLEQRRQSESNQAR